LTPPPLDLSGGLLRVVGLITPRQVVDENDRSPIAPQMRACSIGAGLPVDRLRPLEDLIRELAQLLVLPVFQHERRQEDRLSETTMVRSPYG